MKQKYYYIFTVAMLMVGLLTGCGNAEEGTDTTEQPESTIRESEVESASDQEETKETEEITEDTAGTVSEAPEALAASPEVSSDIVPEETSDCMNLPADAEEYSSWQEAYRAFIGDWKLIENYGYFSYLDFYFGSDYIFDSYWLCDVDQNGTPELFLYSNTMYGMTAVFTYADRPVYLEYDCINGINLETAELVIHGHWHGAGGSWDNEWTAYQVQGDKAEYNVYIDYFELDEGENTYTVYDPGTDTYNKMHTSEEYDEEYAIHVAPRILVEEYVKYELADENGLKNIQ